MMMMNTAVMVKLMMITTMIIIAFPVLIEEGKK